MGFFRNLLHLDAEGNQDYYFNLSFGDNLPLSSVELEYLQSTGTQYINTGIAPDTINTTIEIKYQYLNNLNTGADSIMGSRNGNTIHRFYPSSRSGTSVDRMVLGNTVIETPYDVKVHTVLFNDANHDCYLDGELIGNAGTNFTPHSQPMYMFALNCEGNKSYQGACRIYYCKIWKNGELVSYMKPCQNADGTLCFYDTVRKERFYNAGTGEFVCMHKTNIYDLPEGYTALEYVTATGGQYLDIGTRLWATQDWILKTTVAADTFTSNNQLIGTKNTINVNYETKLNNKSYYYKFNNVSNSGLTTLESGVPVTITQDNTSGVLVNIINNTFNTATKASTSLNQDLNFGHRLGGGYFQGKLYGLEMWKDGYKVRNFIPCKNTEGEVGLFDKIENTFYPSTGDLPFYDDVYEESSVPEEYIQVDYISSTGTQYINTGIYPNGDMRYDLNFSGCKTSGVLFGAYNNTWTDGYGLYTNAGTSGKYYMHYYSNTNTNITSTSIGNIIMDRGIININNTTFTCNSDILTSNVMYPLYLCAGNMDGSVEQPVICDIKRFRVYSHDLLLDLVPVVRNSDSKPGMYDKVSGEFFTSASSTDFIAAPIKEEIALPEGYSQLDAICSSETQYINTGVIPTISTGFDITYNVHDQFVANDTLAGALFGARTAWYHDAYNLTTYSAGNYTKGHLLYGGMASASGDAGTIRNNAGMSRDVIETLSFRNGILTKPDYTRVELNPGLGINTTYPIYIFGINQAGSFIEPSTMDLYRLKFYEGDELIRDFIPAIRDADGEVGLYCTVTKEFYTNMGSGSFTPIYAQDDMSGYVLDSCDLLYDGIMSKPEGGIWTNLIEGGPNINYGSSFTVGEKSLDLTCTSASSTAQRAQVMTTFPSNYTVEYTFRAHNHTTGVAGLVILNSNSSILYMHFTQDDFINLSGYIYNVGQGYDVDYVDGGLYHVAFTYQPGRYLIYINGVHVKTINSSTSYSSITNMTVGPYRYSSNSIYPGGTQHSYYAVRRHTRVLTPEEIAQNAAEDLARYA